MIKAKDYKVFIFDFDETMYYSENMKECYIRYIRKVLKDLTCLDAAEIENKLELFGFKSDGKTRISFGKNCEKFGVTQEKWNEYRVNNFFEIDYENAVVADNHVYKKLSYYGNLYIVSNEIKENIEYKALKMGIDLSCFKEICAPTKADVLNYKVNKKEVYKSILNKEKCGVLDAIIIGDRYNVDVLPFEEMGGKGIVIKRADEINKLFNF